MAESQPPVPRYGLVLKYRKAGGDSFKASRSWALECFRDTPESIYVSQTGALGVVPGDAFRPGEDKEKAPLSQHGLELTVRKADGKTVKFGLECYSDENNGNLLYLTETGSLSVVPARYARLTKGKPKGAPLRHGLKLKVRTKRESGEDVRTYGVDVFEDRNNDNLIYLSEIGSVAVVPQSLVDRDTTANREPVWQYAFRLAVRGAGQRKFAKDSKKYGVEVFRDANNGCLIYTADNGSLAVVPARLARFPEGKPRGGRWLRGMNLAVRAPDEKNFTRTTRQFGVEVYTDENNGNRLYLSDRGTLAIVVRQEKK